MEGKDDAAYADVSEAERIDVSSAIGEIGADFAEDAAVVGYGTELGATLIEGEGEAVDQPSGRKYWKKLPRHVSPVRHCGSESRRGGPMQRVSLRAVSGPF